MCCVKHTIMQMFGGIVEERIRIIFMKYITSVSNLTILCLLVASILIGCSQITYFHMLTKLKSSKLKCYRKVRAEFMYVLRLQS